MTKDHDLMTDEARRSLRQLIDGRVHPAPCSCPACLYAEFQKRKRRPGQPTGKIMFFLDWLVWRIKMEVLAEKYKHSSVTICFDRKLANQFPGFLTWSGFQEQYKKAPYLRRVQEVIDTLYDDFLEIEVLEDHSVIRLYKTRFESDRFVKFIESLQLKRSNAVYDRPEKKREVQETWDRLRFAQRVGRFIHAQPKKRITQHALLRHFSNERKNDLTDILETLESNFRIHAERRGKSIVYRVISKKPFAQDLASSL